MKATLNNILLQLKKRHICWENRCKKLCRVCPRDKVADLNSPYNYPHWRNVAFDNEDENGNADYIIDLYNYMLKTLDNQNCEYLMLLSEYNTVFPNNENDTNIHKFLMYCGV